MLDAMDTWADRHLWVGWIACWTLVASVAGCLMCYIMVICGIPPLDILTTAGDTEGGRITGIERMDVAQSVDLALPVMVGVYRLTIESSNGTIERLVDARVLNRSPRVGDYVSGNLYMKKSRFEKEWSVWQPLRHKTFPDYTYAWIKAELGEVK